MTSNINDDAQLAPEPEPSPLDLVLEEYKLRYALDEIPDVLDDKDKIIYNLIHGTANDCNSSTFREHITIVQSGYIDIPGKLGYDANTLDGCPVEIKPQNIIIKENGKKNGKMGGQGTFTDLTYARYNKYIAVNLLMCVSGFYDGKLKFIVSFDFNSPKFSETLKDQLDKRLPDGDKPGHYLRSGSFGWNAWKDANNIKLIYLSNNIKEHMITKPLHNYLSTLSDI